MSHRQYYDCGVDVCNKENGAGSKMTVGVYFISLNGAIHNNTIKKIILPRVYYANETLCFFSLSCFFFFFMELSQCGCPHPSHKHHPSHSHPANKPLFTARRYSYTLYGSRSIALLPRDLSSCCRSISRVFFWWVTTRFS